MTYIVDMPAHSVQEGDDVVEALGDDELAIVEPEANPEIVHQDREERHHGRDAKRTAKLVSDVGAS